MGVMQGVGVAREPPAQLYKFCTCTREALQWWFYLRIIMKNNLVCYQAYRPSSAVTPDTTSISDTKASFCST